MMITRILRIASLLVLGAAGLFVVQRFMPGPMPPAVATAPAPGPEAADTHVLTLTSEAIRRAGILVADVSDAAGSASLRLPATVEPQGYRVVDVTPIAGGTVLAVTAELGSTVREGAVVARLRSPDVTDEVRRWLTLRAERAVASQRLARTQALAQIGAASRQDVEQDQAGEVRVSTELETSRVRLARLGVTDATLASLKDGDALPETFDVLAHAGGIVIRRAANPGQNIDETQAIVTVADPSVLWVMADVFEADLAQVRLGQTARVTADAFPGREWHGRLVYIEPEVSRETRTVRVRIEVANPDAVLRFGMFVSVSIGTAPAPGRISVPTSALQSIGAATVAYVELREGRYEERVVSTAANSGDRVQVVSGLQRGDRVVVAGSVALRAERERLGWPVPAPAPAATAPPSPARGQTSVVLSRVVEVTAEGLVPARVLVPANQAVDLVFIRRVEETCGVEVAIPDLGVRRPLPLNERVIIRVAPRPPGELSFSCGMNMLKGVIVIGG